MLVDLNEHTEETLTDLIRGLRPSQAMRTKDGLVVRRRQNSSGYDLGVGPGGHGARKRNGPREAAGDLLKQSAGLTLGDSLGGEDSFPSAEAAFEAIEKGKATPAGPSPAVKALRRVASRSTLHSYRTRAESAQKALAKGDVATAVRHLEAIVEHAGTNGKFKDVTRAQEALETLTSNHDYKFNPGELRTSVRIVSRDGGHIVYVGGNPVTAALGRREAEARKSYHERRLAREQDVDDINKEISELPSALSDETGQAA